MCRLCSRYLGVVGLRKVPWGLNNTIGNAILMLVDSLTTGQPNPILSQRFKIPKRRV